MAFLARLLEGRREVTDLLAKDPFGTDPPRFVRASLYRYRFTTGGSDAWWSREPLGLYLPPLARRAPE